MLTLHHLENSRSFGVIWLLEELNVNYDIKSHKRNKKTSLADKSLRKIHPLGKLPIITDGDFVLAETPAILQYIYHKYGDGKLMSATGSDEYIRQNYWLFASEGSLMPYLMLDLVTSRIASGAPFIIRPIAKAISKQVDAKFTHPNLFRFAKYMEAELTKNQWFGGDKFSIADIQMGYPVEAAIVRLKLGNDYPKLKAFLVKIKQRPAYKTAIEKGGNINIIAS